MRLVPLAPARSLVTLLLPAALAACTEYGLEKGEDPPVGGGDTVDTGEPPVDSEDTGDPLPDETGEGETDIPPTLVPCDQVALEALTWWGSQPFAAEPDPADGAGRAFWRTDYEMTGWSTVSMPDSGHNPPGNDRAYRGVFHLDAVSEGIWVDLQSDDGLWLWVNGVAVGHWGGGHLEEGCVNDEARCSVTNTVAPVEVTDLLVAGDNLVAARVSNAVDASYFQLHARCEE